MFGVGVTELLLAAVVGLAGILAWLSWRDRWVRVAREWYVDLPAEDLDDMVTASFAQARVGRLRPGAPDGWIHSVSRIPAWALVLGLLTLPLGVLLLVLVREHADLHLRVRSEGSGSRLRVVGQAPAGTVRALESWMDDASAGLLA